MLKGLCDSKAQRFKDDILRIRKTTDISSQWLYQRIKKLLLPSNFVACETCGMAMTFEGITLDHKVPRSKHKQYKGNIHDVENLQLICPTCNSMKGQKTLTEFINELHERNNYILQLAARIGRKEVVAPLFPKVGLGIELFGDKSSKRFNTQTENKRDKSAINRNSTQRKQGKVRKRKHFHFSRRKKKKQSSPGTGSLSIEPTTESNK